MGKIVNLAGERSVARVYSPPVFLKERKMRRGVYAGSFDPVTNGHLWMIERGMELFDEMIVAIGENPDKKYTFNHNERM